MMYFNNKILIVIFAFVIIGFIPIAFLFAQETVSGQEPIQQLQETINQLEEQIARLQGQIQELIISQSTPETTPTITEPVFTQTLSKGSRGEEVTKLQEYLAQFPDIYPEGFITGYFGSLTETAVKRFQEKYSEDILAPWGLTEGTGYVGETTVAKLNELMAEEAAVGEEIAGEVAEEVITEEAATTLPEVATTTEETIEDAVDITPPADVANLTAMVDVGSAAFSWTNPSDEDFSGTRIMKRWWNYPRDVNDGTKVYDGKATSFTDYGLIAGITYHYQVFTYDEALNYSSGIGIKFTPTSTQTLVIEVTVPAGGGGTATGGTATGGTTGAADTTPPAISNFQPSGTTTDATPTLSLNTNEVSACRYASTTDKSYNTMTGSFNTTGGTYHYNTLSLMALGTYTYYARCQDTAGNQTATSTPASTTFTIATGIVDTTAPVISNVQTSGISITSTTVTWQTDEDSDSVVNYGLTASYGSIAFGATDVTYHEVTLSNLTSETTYHYKVISTDSSSNKAESQDKTFTTLASDTTPPIISDIQASNITQTSATITWVTNESSDSKVDYSLTSSITDPTTITDTNNVTSHTISLTNLTSNTTYYYTVASTDASNNTTVSAKQSFTTLSPPSSPNTYSMDFENSAGENQYLSIGDGQQIGLEPTQAITIEAWVKLESTSQTVTIVGKDKGSQKSQQSYRFDWDSGDVLRFHITTQVAGPTGARGEIEWHILLPQTVGEWKHLAVSWRTYSSRPEFYINGNKSGDPALAGTASELNNNTSDVNVGANWEGSTNFMDGKMDEVRVWNVARTASEIAANYNKELIGNEPGLVGYWKFNNELVGGKVKDETSNHNDLTLNNNPVFSADTPF